VYHGFIRLEDVSVDGFTLGKISNFEAEEMDYDDAFVIAQTGPERDWSGRSVRVRGSRSDCRIATVGAYRRSGFRRPRRCEGQSGQSWQCSAQSGNRLAAADKSNRKRDFANC
jgi:hypothetical protein